MQDSCTKHFYTGGAKRRASLRGGAGFTLVEVMVAFGILIISICSSLLTLQFSLKSLDTARCTTLAAQLMQTRVETLRLMPWSGGTANIQTETNKTFTTAELAAMVPSDAATVVQRFQMSQTVVNDGTRNMRTFTISVSWTSSSGTSHTRTTTMRYAQNGLYDFYVNTE